MKTLLIGYGNVMRCDDGAGVRVAETIEKEQFAEVEVRTYQQLQVDLVNEFSHYERVILVDASVEGPEVNIRKIRPSSYGHMASSHHLGPDLLLRLSQIVHLGEPELYLCTIRGECFDFGETLSSESAKRAEAAVVELRKLICHERMANARG